MKVAEILQHIQTELKAPKNQKNNFGGYKYRNLESILENVKPLLNKYNAVLTITDDIITVGERIYVKAIATIMSVDDGDNIAVSAYAREDVAKKGMDLSQLTGACSSYARKYALNGLFCIDDTKDADELEQTGEQQNTPVRRSRRKIKVDETCPF